MNCPPLAIGDDVKVSGDSPELIMTYGLPRSGKSTWARARSHPVVEMDAIRLAKTGQRWWSPIEHEVWAFARTIVRTLFLSGYHFVILDSTSYSRKQRDFFLPSKDVPWRRFYKEFDMGFMECIRRAHDTGHPELEEIIKFQDAHWDCIQKEEEIFPW
jgi:predicted kinase